jgi:hypothetical protein
VAIGPPFIDDSEAAAFDMVGGRSVTVSALRDTRHAVPDEP